MKKISYLFILLLTLTGTLVAEDDSNWVYGKIISDIQFEGLNNIAESELDGVVTPYIGELFSDELFLELQTLMYELDYFEFIVPSAKEGDPEKKSVIIVFQVQESPSISKIKFEGNDSIWSTTLTSKIILKSKDIYSDYKVERAKNAILEEYYNKGYSNVTVEIEKESNQEDNSLEITFIVEEGDQTLIREVRFNGNNLFATDKKLNSLIETKKKTLFNDGVYKESIIQADKLLIEGYYHNNGYVNAKVVDIKTSLTPDEKKPELFNMEIDFYIDEGEQYTYGGVEITGNEIYKTEEFLELDRQDIGDIYSKGRHDSDYLAMRDLYYNNGYVDNVFDDQIIIDEDSKVISHKIVILERPIAHIGRISLSGNEKTKDIVLYRDIPIENGDIYSKEKVFEAYRNLMHTGLFTAVKPIPRKNDEGDMDIEFAVEEQRTFLLNGGIAVAGRDFEPSLTFSARESNFMGMGRTFGGTVNLGLDTQLFSLNYKEPRILNSNFWGGGGISLQHTLENVYEAMEIPDQPGEYYEFPLKWYDADKSIEDNLKQYEEDIENGDDISASNPDIHEWDISLRVEGGHSWYNPWGIVKASTGYKTGMSTFLHEDHFTPFPEKYRDGKGEWVFDDSIWVRGQIDGRDVPIGTTEGYALMQWLSYGGVLPFEHDKDYIKSITSADYYFKIVDTPITEEWDMILTLRLHAAYTRLFSKPGMSFEEEDKSVSMGGMLEGRGWASMNDGVALLDLKAELNMPVVPQILGTSLFFDAVNLWRDESEVTNFDIEDFRFSFGGSFGITNPMMPIAVYVAQTFKVVDGSVEWSPGNHNEIGDTGLTFGVSFNINQFIQ